MSLAGIIKDLAPLGLFPVATKQLRKGVISAPQASLIVPLTGKFEQIDILLANIRPVTADSDLLATFSIDGGSTFVAANYSWSQVIGDGSSGAAPAMAQAGGVSATSLKVLTTLSASTIGSSVRLSLYYPSDAVDYKSMHWRGTHRVTASLSYKDTMGQGRWEGTQALTHVKFAFSAGNIAAARYSVNGFNG